MDGVDIAEIKTDGQKIFALGQTASKSFTPVEVQQLKLARGKWPGAQEVELAAKTVEEKHLALLRENSRHAIIGFHGQTLAHDPKQGKTHQAGNGVHLANELSRTVVWDFRTMDMRNGGEGAPLAPFYHFALAKHLDIKEVCAFINIGGITNITVVDPQFEMPEEDGALSAFDIGPGNFLIDSFCQLHKNLPFDRDGNFASNGKIDQNEVASFLTRDSFKLKGPRSFDIHDFTISFDSFLQTGFENAVATLTEFTIQAIIKTLEQLDPKPRTIILCGGGTKNTYLVKRLVHLSDVEMKTADEWGLNAQYLEAQAFGFLAARVINHLPISAPSTTGCNFPTHGGQISYSL